MKKGSLAVTVAFPAMILILLLLSPGCRKEEEPVTVVDIDGNLYRTLPLGSQLWMVENLQVTRYRNGDSIGTTYPSTLDVSSETDPVYQWSYEGNDLNISAYGRLYTWYAATDKRNVCPVGWHVPTDAELTALEMFVGGLDIKGNLSEFLGGYRNVDGTFDSLGLSGYWWSSTASDGDHAWMRSLNEEDRLVNRNNVDKSYGFSIKCLQD